MAFHSNLLRKGRYRKEEPYDESADPADAVIVYESKQAWQWWKPTLVAVDIVFYGGLVIAAFLLIKNGIFAFFDRKED